MSACVGPRPPVSPFSSAMASSSAVTRQPAFFSCDRSASKAARSSFFSAASRSSTSGMKGAPGSVGGFLDQARPADRGFPRPRRWRRRSGARVQRMASVFIARPP